MHIDIIDDIETLRRQKDTSCELYKTNPDAQFFISWTWMVNWLDAIDDQWLVLAAGPSKAAASYVAFFPIQLWSEHRQSDGFVNTIQMGGTAFAGYMGFLGDPEYDDYDDVAISAFSQAIFELNWSAVHFERLHLSERRLDLLLNTFSVPDFRLSLDDRPEEGYTSDHFVYPCIELPGDRKS